MDRQPVLVATEGTLSGKAYPITAEGLSIGRETGCDISLDGDPDVSRQHARVFLHNSAVWAQDAGSRNGVFVNGKRLQRPKQVGPGDRLGVGTHEFTVELRRPEGDDEASNITVVPDGVGDGPAPQKSARPAESGGASPLVVGLAVLVVAALAVLGWILVSG